MDGFIRSVSENFPNVQRLKVRSKPTTLLKVFFILALIQLVYYGSLSSRSHSHINVQSSEDNDTNNDQLKELLGKFDISSLVDDSYPAPKEADLDLIRDSITKKYTSTSNALMTFLNDNDKVLLSSDAHLDAKCDLFFYYLHSVEDRNWTNEADAGYSADAFSQTDYFNRKNKERLGKEKDTKKEQIRNEYLEQGKEINDGDLEALLSKFKYDFTDSEIEALKEERLDLIEKNLEIEQNKVSKAANLRAFGKCFFSEEYGNSGTTDNSKQKVLGAFTKSTCHFSEKKIFPFLSFNYPIYERWNGAIYEKMPQISNILKNEEIKSKKHKGKFTSDLLPEVLDTTEFGDCFVPSFYNSMNGKGLVLSVSDNYVGEVIKLIRTLRVLGNKYPIQIIHSGDLSQANRKLLVDASRESIKKLIPKVNVSKKEFEKYEYKDYIDHDYPVQEIWFVNVLRAIDPKYNEVFSGYSNKLLAYFFNSFDEMMLLDTDTVLLVPTKSFFKLDKYLKHGAMFFRDRDVDDMLWDFDVEFWKKLMPSVLDKKFFGIPQPTDVTLKNRYIGDYRKHFMEAGLVLVKRSTHFTGILMGLEINLWRTVIDNRMWGDKEYFWLGQSLAGNENYHINGYQAGAAGEVRTVPGKFTHEICSTHPAHILDEDNKTLLWINSGFQNCKKNSWDDDVNNERIKKTNMADKQVLQSFYEDFTKITGVVIPPVTEHSYVNNMNEPFSGWYKLNICSGYYWCGYEVIGASQNDEDKGLLIEFDKDTIEFYDFVGRIWIANV
ncbi:putative alpha-1,3-mannosyltransferase [Saccharomycopsis crataegensis]|uniref:Alpha-1,3-mannosyltransferase n=1 Tax=Saccharomycopsis crataegensis TaxID=43959 RepID=A0AAV5QNN2_9ASCO|nr:putative alpha-1,3-mannosyltransferase [Saccharomycopsis crataegensis]